MLISILGKARVGKDTFAQILAENIFDVSRKRFVLMAFANDLKLRIQKEFDLSYDQLWGDEKEKLDKRYPKGDSFWTAREMMQAYGEFYRSIDCDFWVRSLFRLINENEYDNVIITDVRYPNEANAVKDRNGILIRVRSDRNTGTINGSNHISETAMNDYSDIDFEVVNNGSISDLKATADMVTKYIRDYRK